MRAKAHKARRRDCLRHQDRRAHQRSPVSLSLKERINPSLVDCPHVLRVSISVRRREETELLAGLKISALPAPLKVALPATIPDLTLRWPAIVAAPAFTPKLHHCPKGLVTRLIVGECLEERGKPWSHALEMILAQLLTQIAR
jgi:hypothetical protein